MTLSRLLCTAALVFAGAPACAQNIIYVDDSAPPAGDGSSWQSAHRFLTDAIAHASNTPGADEIRIAEGFYWPDESEANPAGTGDLCAAFELPDSAAHGITKLIGGYRGTGTPGDPNQRDPELFESVLTGDLLGNDPAWPFTGHETEWDDNARVLILANTRHVFIEGLRVQGAFSSSFVTEYGFSLADDVHYTESVVIRDTIFRNSPALSDFGAPCASNSPTGVVIGLSKESSHIFPTDAQLYNVQLVNIACNSADPIIKSARGVTTWLGGGIADSRARAFITSNPDNVKFAGITLRDLTFENLSIDNGHVFNNASDIPVAIEQCVFRNIVVDNSANGPSVGIPSILSLNQYQIAGEPGNQRSVRDCTFENLGILEDDDLSAGAVVFGATLVERCDFSHIYNHLGAVLYAKEANDCTFDDIVIRSVFHNDGVSIDFDSLFGTDSTLRSKYRVALVKDAKRLSFTNASLGGVVLEVVGSAADCSVQDSVVKGDTTGPYSAPVLTHQDTVLSHITIKNNVFGSPDLPASTGDGSAGVVLFNGAELHHSRIEGNKVYTETTSRFVSASAAAHMYWGSGIYNSVIVGNGESVIPGDTVAHCGIKLNAIGGAPCSIVQSTICGNYGHHIGGIEIDAQQPQNVLWAHLINSVVANNTSTDEFLEPERWDLSTNENSSSTDPAGFAIINSIRTIDGPVFVDPGSNNYQPAPGSAAIDAGDDSSVPADIFDLDNDGDTTEPVPFDAGGNPRFADDPAIPGSSVDIGAHEFQGTSCLADVNRDGMLSPTDFSAWVGAFNTNAPECDQNGDGMCTPTDFSAWVGNFNAGC